MGSRWIPRITRPGTGGGSGPTGTDHFAPAYIVGNVTQGDPAVAQVAPFRYIPDPGDGTGIEQALSEAALTGGVVYVRRGAYFLTEAISPLTVPSGVIMRGEGWGANVGIGTIIAAPTVGTQRAISMQEDSTMEDLLVVSLETTGAITDTGIGVVEAKGRATLNRVGIRNLADAVRAKPQRACLWAQDHPKANQCFFEGYDTGIVGASASIGIVIGSDPDEAPSGWFFSNNDNSLVDCTVIANIGVLYQDISGGSIVGGRYETIGSMPAGEDSAAVIVRQKSEIEIGSAGIRMPKIANATLVVSLDVFVEADGVLIDSDPSGEAAEPQPLKSFQMTNTSIEVLGGVNGVRIVSRASFSDRGQLSDIALSNVHIDGSPQAAVRVVAEASERVGVVRHVKITNLTMSWENAPLFGIALEPADDSATIDDVGIVNCNLSGHDVGSTAISIGDGVTRTTIVGNALYGSGTPIADSGSLTEASSNQMT